LEALASLLSDHDPMIMWGGTSARELSVIRTTLDDLGSATAILLLTTVPYGGSGFDAPALDTAFLVGPISYPGLVKQAVGRVLRRYPGKSDVIVHDYVDSQVPVLAASFAKRKPVYRQIGFVER
jgi:superfamily II DNA or RNA helicase